MVQGRDPVLLGFLGISFHYACFVLPFMCLCCFRGRTPSHFQPSLHALVLGCDAGGSLGSVRC